MGGAMLSKSFSQFSFEGWGSVPFLLFDLRPNYGGGNEDNGDLLQRDPYVVAMPLRTLGEFESNVFQNNQ